VHQASNAGIRGMIRMLLPALHLHVPGSLPQWQHGLRANASASSAAAHSLWISSCRCHRAGGRILPAFLLL
jgi:hypothetical protein